MVTRVFSWSIADSNCPPLRCERSALPDELIPLFVRKHTGFKAIANIVSRKSFCIGIHPAPFAVANKKAEANAPAYY